jgi:cytochrome c oxidase subunit 2
MTKVIGSALLVAGASVVFLGAAMLASGGLDAAEQGQVIKVEARRFVFTPKEIAVKKGQPVILEFTSLDFVHGFNVPGLKLRADLPPGQITRVRFTPDQAGTYMFVCDNFCGEGHEEMQGRIVVTN